MQLWWRKVSLTYIGLSYVSVIYPLHSYPVQYIKIFIYSLVFSRNQNRPWLGSVSFENWHPKVRFEYWTIFEGYFRAEIFQKQFWTFGQSLIFNVFFRKKDILSTLKMSLKGDLNTSFMRFIGQIGNGRVCSLIIV